MRRILGWCGHFQRGGNWAMSILAKSTRLGSKQGKFILFLSKGKQQTGTAQHHTGWPGRLAVLGIAEVGTVNIHLLKWERCEI